MAKEVIGGIPVSYDDKTGLFSKKVNLKQDSIFIANVLARLMDICCQDRLEEPGLPELTSRKYVAAIYAALTSSLPPGCSCYTYRSEVDHFNFPLVRFICEGPKFKYIVDFSHRIDTKVHYTWWQRLKFKLTGDSVSQRGTYTHELVRVLTIWNSPVSFYRLDFSKKLLPAGQSTLVQTYVEDKVGVSIHIRPGMKSYYERIDHGDRDKIFDRYFASQEG